MQIEERTLWSYDSTEIKRNPTSSLKRGPVDGMHKGSKITAYNLYKMNKCRVHLNRIIVILWFEEVGVRGSFSHL